MANGLLLIHGVGCDGSVWDRMAPLFREAGFEVEAPTLFADKRRRRNPPDDLGQLTLRDYIDAAAEKAGELAARTGAKPAVMGHSMGGLIAQKLAERGDVSAGVFLTPASPEGCTVFDLAILRTFWSVVSKGQKNLPGQAVKVGRNGFSWGVLNAVERNRHDAIYARALYDSGQVYADLAQPPAVEETRITIPTLTIGAKRDRATVIRAVRKVGEKYAHAAYPGDYLEYANHAHWIVDEPGSDKVASDILMWLKRQDARPPEIG